MKLKDCLNKIIDNRGRNPKYYEKELYPVIDNVMIKNNYHPNITEATRFIDQDTHDNFLRGYLEPNLPIMTLVGAGIGNVSLSIDDKSVIVQNTIGFKTNPELLDSVYLYYWFLYKHDELVQFNRGSGQPSIRKTDIENMDIDIKDIGYQKRVSKILSNIDEKIELNNKISNNLHELINQQYSKYLDDIKDYEELDIKDIFEFETGVEPGSKNYLDKEESDTIKFYRVGDMNSKCNTFVKQNLVNGKCINEDDIVVSFDATIGRIGYCLNGSYSTGMKKISIKEKYKNIVDNSIVYAYFNSNEVQNVMKENARGTTILHASSSIDFMTFKYNELLLKKYSKIISISFEKMKNIKKENDELSQLRDDLLPRLMNEDMDLDSINI